MPLFGPDLTADNIDQLLRRRRDTLDVLDEVIRQLRDFGKTEKGLSLVSTGGSLISGVAATVLFLAAPVTGGTTAVLGGAIVSCIGIASAGLSLGTLVVTHLVENGKLETAQRALEMDAIVSRKLEKFIGAVVSVYSVYSNSKELISKMRELKQLSNGTLVIRGVAKTGTRKMISNVATIVMVPVNLAMFIKTSVDIYKCNFSKTADKLEKIKIQLEEQYNAVNAYQIHTAQHNTGNAYQNHTVQYNAGNAY